MSVESGVENQFSTLYCWKEWQNMHKYYLGVFQYLTIYCPKKCGIVSVKKSVENNNLGW